MELSDRIKNLSDQDLDLLVQLFEDLRDFAEQEQQQRQELFYGALPDEPEEEASQ